MGKKNGQFNPSIFIVIILLFFLALMAYYFFLWVPEQKARLCDRYLRLAAMMSDQVETRGRNVEAVIKNADKSITVTDENQIEKNISEWRETLRSTFPDWEFEYRGYGGPVEKKENILFSDVDYNSPANQIEFAVEKRFDLAGAQYAALLSMKMDVNNFVGEIYQREEFDDVLIVNRAGEVIYSREQYKKTGINLGLRVLKISTLFQNPKEQSDLQSDVIDITIAQTGYKTFLQPIPLRFIESKSLDKTWFIAAMVSEDNFSKRGRKISNHVLLAFVLLIALAFIGFPLAKLRLMGSGDSLKARDVIFLVLSFVFGIPIITYFIITVSGYFMDTVNCGRDLEDLAQHIHDNFTEEIQLAHKELTFLSKHKEILSYGGETNPENRGTHLLKESAKIQKTGYPYYDMVFLMNDRGKQVYKGVVDESRVTFHDVSGRNYFKKIKDKDYWFTKENEPMMLEPVYSKSTGRYEINLSIPLDLTDEENNRLAAAGMSFRPLSVINPVLPEGFGFAVFDPRGKVLFHSDPRLNLNENFFTECENAGNLISAVFSRAENLEGVTYQGKRWNLYLMPIKNIPWTLVVFKDRDILGSRNLEKIFSAWLIYLLYMGVLAVLLFFYMLLYFLRGKVADPGVRNLHVKFKWIWPEKALRLKYSVITLLNLFLFLLLLFLVYIRETPSKEALYLPVMVLMAVYLVIMNAFYRRNGLKSKFRNFFAETGLAVLVLILLFRFKGIFFDTGISIDSIMLLPVVVYFIPLFIPGETTIRRIKDNWFYRNSHSLLIYSFLLLFIVYPALLFYHVAAGQEKIAAVRYNQLNFARDYWKWEKWRCRNYDVQEKMIREFSDDPGTLSRNLGVYTLPSSNTDSIGEMRLKKWQLLDKEIPVDFNEATRAIKDAVKDFPPEFELTGEELERDRTLAAQSWHTKVLRLISKIIPFDNKYSDRVRYLYAHVSKDLSLIWPKELMHERKKIYLIYHEKPNLAYNKEFGRAERFYVVSGLPENEGNGTYLWIGIFAAVFFLTVILYAVVFYVGKFIFLTGLGVLPGNEPFITVVENEIDLIQGRSLVFGKSVRLKSKTRGLKKQDYLELDCLENNIYEKLKKSAPADMKYVFLYNLDYKKHDHRANLLKLNVLEQLVFTHDSRNIVVFSQVDPLQYFTVGDPAELKRWERLIRCFDLKYTVEMPEKKEPPKGLPGKIRLFIDDECKDSKYLLMLREQLFSELQGAGAEDFDVSALKETVSRYAKPVYDMIWRTASKEEKLVLIHLARGGLVNIRSKAAIRGLLKRELIRLCPLRLMNRTFRDYILGADDLASILEWKEEQEKSNWSKTKRPLLFLVTGVIVFLVVTQPGVLKSWLVLIPAVSAAVPALLRLIDGLSGNSAGNA